MLFHNPLARHTKTNSDTLSSQVHKPSKWKKKVDFLMTLQGCFTFCSLKECRPQRCYCVNTLVWLQSEQHTSTSTDESSLSRLWDKSEVTILVWRSHIWQDPLSDSDCPSPNIQKHWQMKICFFFLHFVLNAKIPVLNGCSLSGLIKEKTLKNHRSFTSHLWKMYFANWAAASGINAPKATSPQQTWVPSRSLLPDRKPRWVWESGCRLISKGFWPPLHN